MCITVFTITSPFVCLTLFIGRFTMVFSETPDMSDTGQEFALQASQQQQARGQLSSANSTMGGARGGVNSTAVNGRIGMGPAITGNRNGNNHMTTVTAVNRPLNGVQKFDIQPAVDPLSQPGMLQEQKDANRPPQPLFDPRGAKFDLPPHPHNNDHIFESGTLHPLARGRTYEQFNPHFRHSNHSDPRYHPYQRPHSNQCPPSNSYQ